MSLRVRAQRRDSSVPPALYLALRRHSVLLQAAGMLASGWLIFRSLFLWGLHEEGWPFGADMPIALVIVLAWLAAIVLMFRPPRSVLASVARPIAGSSLVVWPLGRPWRFWFAIAVPVVGVLPVLVPAAIAKTFDFGADSSDVLLRVPLGLGFTLGPLVLIWIVLRSVLLGVELTPTHLVACGFFFTRRFERGAVLDVAPVSVGLGMNMLFSLMNMYVDAAVRLTLVDGRSRRLYASSSDEGDVASGTEIIRRWCGFATTASPGLGIVVDGPR